MINPSNQWEEFFSKKHTLSSKLLNNLGLPVLRTILTNSLINFRRYKNCRPKDGFELELLKNGIITIPNFLPTNEFLDLKKEFSELISKKKNEDRNFKGVKSTTIKYNEFEQFPSMKNLRDNKFLNRLICVGEGLRSLKINSFLIENTRFGSTKHQRQDPNNLFHADVHFHSHKVFYYMNDITEDHGPFTYLKGTHQNNLNRLLYEFKRARLDNATEFAWRLENNLQNKFFKRYLNNLLKNKYKAIGRANTLIIGNVHGFHKVGDALEGNERELIRITFRHNPIEVINKLTKPLRNFITQKN